MAIAQPLTAFSDRLDDETLKGIDTNAPRIRKVHRALDACAEESGPQRYESAWRVAPESGDGAFYLMGSEPSPALAALFETADRARQRFTDQLALSWDLAPPEGDIRVIEANPVPCNPRAPMDTYLRMLERDEATSPSTLEGLFEDLEQAHRDDLIAFDAEGLALTDAGREMIAQARPALAPLSNTTMGRVDLYAQEVADGRLSLREAIASLGAEIGIELPVPGQLDKIEAAGSYPDAGVRVDTAAFDPLLIAVSEAASRNRASVATLALHRRLEEWGLSHEEAESILRHDIRCLRALGASLSHGPLRLSTARSIVEQDGLAPLVDAAAAAVPDALLKGLAGSRRPSPDPEPEPEIKPEASIAAAEEVQQDVDPAPTAQPPRKRMGFFRRLLSVFLRRHW
jgi:hypothetical protein